MSSPPNRSTDHARHGPILIVDDNAFFREGLATILSQKGFLVAQAGNGQQAIDHLQCVSQPALILLDMFMPVMDGWEFFRRCQKLSVLLPPIVITTGLEIATDEWAREMGAVGLLQKPLEVDTLLKEVGRHCQA
jgi:CheY-like chemotaxis protein